MSTRDKFIIVLILVLTVILGIALKAEAGITIGGTTEIECEYELAKYAYEKPYDFVTSDIDISWLTPGALNLHNVTCTCNQTSHATIGWTTAYCINHNGGTLTTEKTGKNPHIVNVIDIKWDIESKQYKAWIRCEYGGEVAIVEKVYTEDFIGDLAKGVYLAKNEGRIY